jgi:quinol monooxygenase YgiN
VTFLPGRIDKLRSARAAGFLDGSITLRETGGAEEMIYVIATIDLAEGKRALYLEELNRIVPLVRSENGCLEYGPAADIPAGIPIQEPADASTVTIIERWSDIDALKIHLSSPHMESYRKAVTDYVKRVGIRVLEPLENQVGAM